MSQFRRPAPTSPDDPRLVEITMNLVQQLGIPKLNIKEVSWTNIIPAGRGVQTIPLDWCFFFRRHAIVMPARMMGKLTAEEWRPLIASSIVFEKKLRRSTDWRWWLHVLLPIFLVLAGSVATFAILKISWISLTLLLLVIPVVILGNRHYRAYLKKARLEADTDASTLAGKESFLEVLRKIQTMCLGDVEMSNADVRILWPLALPTITERIDNLRGLLPSDSNHAT